MVWTAVQVEWFETFHHARNFIFQFKIYLRLGILTSQVMYLADVNWAICVYVFSIRIYALKSIAIVSLQNWLKIRF